MPSVRRHLSLLIPFLCLTLTAAAASPQIGGMLKKRIPKPSVPGTAAAPAAAPAGRAPYGSGINDELIDKFIKAMAVQKDALAKEMAGVEATKADAAAKRAKSEALARQHAEGMVATMMKTGECTDAFKEKDPRAKEIARLEDQVANADDARAEEIRKKLDPLEHALEVDADRACGGKGVSALEDCMAKKKVDLGKQGVTEPMLSIQAQGECMQNPETSGLGGATAVSSEAQAAQAEEEAANKAAQDAMANAKANAEKAGMDAAGLTPQQFAMLDHCIRNRINGGPGCAPDSNDAIDRRAGDLKKALS